MNIDTIKNMVNSDLNYSFLQDNPRLGDNVVLLTLGGSYAYGTNTEHSDVDVRGIAARNKRDILLGRNFEQIVDNATDTTIYSLDKMIKLLTACNPNTIEILGCKSEHYIKLSEIGESLLENRQIFLSQLAINSFGGYANQQLRRLENKAASQIEQKRQEEHILKTLNHSLESLREKYQKIPDVAFKLYVDEALSGESSDIFCDINLRHYPLRDYEGLLVELNNICRSYDKLGVRNSKALQHQKIGKHSMHLLRLYMMCIDILEKGEIVTYRRDEHDLLMSVRNGEYLDASGMPNPDFYEILDTYCKRLDCAKSNTSLPKTPNMHLIDDWLYWANGKIVNK